MFCCFSHSVCNFVSDKRGMKRAQSTSSAPSPHLSNGAGAGDNNSLYRGELNKLEVQEGYGMGLAIKKVCARVFYFVYTCHHDIFKKDNNSTLNHHHVLL